ncbi:hypothetical protein KP509_1Z152000 [Ceratopteris richardii]|nr:hypothetical protein KP509_1Z152000 [Ceratopteris richardii]
MVSANKFLQTVFSTFDENGDGSVSVSEICSILGRLGMPTSEQSIQSFLGGLLSNTQTHVKEGDVFDKDGNGFITPEELQIVLSSLGFPEAAQIDDCVDMIARVDENGDGRIDFVEFKKLFSPEGSGHPQPFVQTL